MMYVKKMSCLLCLLLMMNAFSIPCNAMEIQTVVAVSYTHLPMRCSQGGSFVHSAQERNTT